MSQSHGSFKKTVLVDLDGTLADYSNGFQGIDHIGEPIPGAVAFTQRLSEFARVVIYTTRCKAYPEGVPGPDGVPEPNRSSPDHLAGIVQSWLDKGGFVYDEIYIGQGKPIAACIIDDRAVVCRPQSPFVNDAHSEDGIEGVYREALLSAKNFCGVT